MLQSFIVRAVGFCCRHFIAVIAVAIVASIAAGIYTARNFAIDTNIDNLLSSKLQWRQLDIAYRAAFPQTADLILVVIDAPTAEQSQGAAQALVHRLAGRRELFRSVQDAGNSSFFRQNGLLFQSPADVSRTMQQFTNAAPVIGGLAHDPSLRGAIDVLSGMLGNVKQGYVSLDSMALPLNLAAATLEDVEQSRPASFSWKELLQEGAPQGLRHIVQIWAVVDHTAVEPGGKATAAVRQAVTDLKLQSDFGATARLTGPVPISDEEFHSVNEGLALNSFITGAIVIFILWLSLRSLRLVAAVIVNLAVGLIVTAAAGILLVGAFNPISMAFAVLFVGLGADFAIQYSIRYRAERHDNNDLAKALTGASGIVGIPLTLAAGAAAAGFLSFMLTSYTGLAQLGIIAGVGMVVAYVASLTLLPALIRAVVPPPEPKPLTFPAMAPIDAVLRRRRYVVVAVTALIVLAGLPALTKLQFDFNPLDLRERTSEPIATLLDISQQTPAYTAEVLTPSDADAAAVAARLAALPEVSETRSLASFIPSDQEPKLAAIRGAAHTLDPMLDAPAQPAPTDAETVAALRNGAQTLRETAGEQGGPGADAAHRLADAMIKLADAGAEPRDRATAAFIPPLRIDLDDLHQSLMAQPVTRASLPADLVRDWMTPDGRERVEAIPKGDSNDNATITRFARAVLKAEPNATGQAIGTLEWGDTIVRAFVEAAILSLVSIAILLWIVLRRLSDVLVTLIPLLAAAAVTLEICALTGFQLNYANIIALPVLLGIGVAFKIYYVTAWRRGQTNFLQSALTRAVFYSTLLTATAFGSLWLSNHPGISSMGKLLALSLACTLASAALFQPALMGDPRPQEPQKA